MISIYKFFMFCGYNSSIPAFVLTVLLGVATDGLWVDDSPLYIHVVVFGIAFYIMKQVVKIVASIVTVAMDGG